MDANAYTEDKDNEEAVAAQDTRLWVFFFNAEFACRHVATTLFRLQTAEIAWLLTRQADVLGELLLNLIQHISFISRADSYYVLKQIHQSPLDAQVPDTHMHVLTHT